MKKFVFGVCALIACFVFASCSHDPAAALDKMKDLSKEAKKVKTADEYIEKETEFMEASIDFYKGNPSKKQIEKYNERSSEFHSALWEAENDFKKSEKKNLKKLTKDKSYKKKQLQLQYDLAVAIIDYEDQKKDKDKDDDDDDDDDD